MIYIDFEGKTPVNTPEDPNFPSWKPWKNAKWKAWLKKSQEYQKKIADLNSEGKIDERNKFIDSKSTHWGKLKVWLQVLSHGKCWFSEVKELYSHYDVEHFRPKKECKDLDGTVHDGYWWLAFEYTNYRLCGNVGNRKKGGWFPLKTGTVQSTYDNPCEESESPYFLDPADPDDVTLIAFNEEGNAIPAPNDSDWEKERVEVTIERLKLNAHEALAEGRKRIWQKMSIEIDNYLTAKSRCGAGCNPAAKQKVKDCLRNILSMIRRDAELSSVANWCLQFRNHQELLKLSA